MAIHSVTVGTRVARLPNSAHIRDVCVLILARPPAVADSRTNVTARRINDGARAHQSVEGFFSSEN